MVSCVDGKRSGISSSWTNCTAFICDVVSAKSCFVFSSFMSHLLNRAINQWLNEFIHFSSYFQALFWYLIDILQGGDEKILLCIFMKRNEFKPEHCTTRRKNNPMSNEFIDLHSDETEIVAILWCILQNINRTKKKNCNQKNILLFCFICYRIDTLKHNNNYSPMSFWILSL